MSVVSALFKFTFPTWSWLGNAGQAANDASVNTYATNNVVTNGDNRKEAIEAIDAEFDITTGHNHDGVNSAPVDASGLTNINNFYAVYQETTFSSASGTSIDVSTAFSGKTAGGTSSTEGVLTTAPDNRVEITDSTTGDQLEEALDRDWETHQ